MTRPSKLIVIFLYGLGGYLLRRIRPYSAGATVSESPNEAMNGTEREPIPSAAETTIEELKPPTTSTEAVDSAIKEEPLRVGQRLAAGADALPRWLAVVSAVSILIFAFANWYLMGFYEQFQVTADEVGFDKATVLVRVASTVGLVGSAFLLIVGAAVALFRRRGIAAVLPTPIWWTALLLSIAIFVAGALSIFELLPMIDVRLAGIAYIANLFVLIELLRSKFLDGDSRIRQGRAEQLARRRPYAQLGIAATAGLVLVGAVLLPWWAYGEGAREGNALVFDPEGQSTTAMETLTGARAQLATLTWVASSPTPFTSASEPVLYLGANSGLTIVFDLSTCTTLRLPATAVIQQVYSDVYPDGQAQRNPPSLAPCHTTRK